VMTAARRWARLQPTSSALARSMSGFNVLRLDPSRQAAIRLRKRIRLAVPLSAIPTCAAMRSAWIRALRFASRSGGRRHMDAKSNSPKAPWGPR
jgi:hypothetical protein